jgi:ferrous iron transport protein B
MNYPHLESPQEGQGDLHSQITRTGEAVPQIDSQLEYSFAGRMGKALEPAFSPLGYDWQITVGILSSFAAREVFVSTMAIIYRVDDEESDSIVTAFRQATRDDDSPLFTPLTCLSVLMFFVFALQCISTVAIVRRETRSWRWPIFQFVYMFAFAWFMAFLVFQGGRLLGFS